jgi:cation diffusion facilitator family transporter
MDSTESNEYTSTVKHVTWVGFIVNALLAAIKIICGIWGRSEALVADGIHSLSDFITDIIVIVFVGLAHRRADTSHPYGYGKYEVFATLLIAVALLLVALGIGYNGIDSIIASLDGEPLVQPSSIALWVAVASIAGKEWLFHYTIGYGKRLRSGSLIANAWHHRTDAMSSIATLLGVGGAIVLGPDWAILDPLASVIISIFIAFSAIKIGSPAIKELLDGSLAPDMVDDIRNIIVATPGVKRFHRLRTRQNGKTIIVDFHIKVNPFITVIAAHDIATRIENSIRARFGEDTIINIHIEPYSSSME